ncbi:MAG TPA: hypothetical protein DDZ38_11165 [Gammaproteobacteria bacterium]|jgi:hypothetical protein|nr:hypothetical protein [Gammaproteobacteria bacterium]|tara:strand:- start:133 stop:729 length:597 start_codon:yes stop_codon:yes gene_type:complete
MARGAIAADSDGILSKLGCRFVLAISVAALWGCGGINLDQQPSSTVILDGPWIVEPGLESAEPRRYQPTGEPPKDGTRVIRPKVQAGGGPLAAMAFITHDFHVIQAERLLIEQARDSMGIRYDPGVYRDISWGQRERGLWRVDAGWQDRDLVIQSRTDGITVLERYRLVSTDRLTVNIQVRAKGADLDLTRRFLRPQN